jgi:hypothetical protein
MVLSNWIVPWTAFLQVRITANDKDVRIETPAPFAEHLDSSKVNSAQVSVKVVRSVVEIEALRSVWSDWPGSRDSDIHSFLTFLRSNQETVRPHVFVLSRCGEPDAVLVGSIIQRPFGFRLGYFTFWKPMTRVMTFSYGSFRGNPCFENCASLVEKVLTSLRDGEADLALFDHVDTDSSLFGCTKRMPGFFFRDHLSPIRRHWIRELPDTIGQLYASLSSSQRSHFRYTAKKLKTDFFGQVRVEQITDVADLDRGLKDVEEIAKKTWQRQFGMGFNTSASVRDFLKTEAEAGWLRVYVLYLADKPCAFWIGAVYRRTFYSDFTGYDPEYTRYSPGLYLLSQMLEEFCSHGVGAVDFGFTDDWYKKRFGNASRHEATVHMFAPTSKGFSLSAMRTVTSFVDEALRGLLERTNLVQNVKKIWRKTALKKGQPVSD